MTSGTVKFEPVDAASGKPGIGQIQSDGSYKIKTKASVEGLVPGEYKIEIAVYKGWSMEVLRVKVANTPGGVQSAGPNATDANKLGSSVKILPDDEPRTVDLTVE